MNQLLATFALLGFLLSFAAHVSALLGIDVAANIPFVWLLHIAIFPLFIPFVLSKNKVLGSKTTFAQIRAHFPGWVVAVGVVLFAYVFINFLLFSINTQGGSPSIEDGKFVLKDHGRLIREISASEYTAFKANELRGVSGHWLVFYFTPFAFFMFGKKSKPDAEAASDVEV